MAYRQLPNSTKTRYDALFLINLRIGGMLPANLPFNPQTVDRFNAFYPVYHTTKQGLHALAKQAGTTAQVIKAKQLASWYIKDFIDALQNAIRRGTIPGGERALYQLPTEKSLRPRIVTEREILRWGDNVIKGETLRVANGGAPITFPSLAEVTTAFEDFRTKNTQQSNDKDTYDNAQEAVQAMKKDADKLILRCWNEIETFYDEGDKPSMRRRAREWGVTYVHRKGEKVVEQ